MLLQLTDLAYAGVTISNLERVLAAKAIPPTGRLARFLKGCKSAVDLSNSTTDAVGYSDSSSVDYPHQAQRQDSDDHSGN